MGSFKGSMKKKVKVLHVNNWFSLKKSLGNDTFKPGSIFQAFKDWKVMVENQTSRKVKKLRPNNGLEFCNDRFNKYCKEEGIARHYLVAGTPQQNGLAESMNQTILERVKCMFINAGLSRNLWAEAVKTTCYLINRCPSLVIEFKLHKKLGMDTKWITQTIGFLVAQLMRMLDKIKCNQEPRSVFSWGIQME